MDREYSHRVRRFNLAGLNHDTNFRIAHAVATLDNDDMDVLYASSAQNLLRLFLAYFLNQPAYVSMGFETRERAIAEQKHYSARRYIQDHVKNRDGAYLWRDPGEFFAQVSFIRAWQGKLRDVVRNSRDWWLNTDQEDVLAWVYFDDCGKASHLFFAHTNGESGTKTVRAENPLRALPATTDVGNSAAGVFHPVYSTQPGFSPEGKIEFPPNDAFIVVENLGAGEGRIYALSSS